MLLLTSIASCGALPLAATAPAGAAPGGATDPVDGCGGDGIDLVQVGDDDRLTPGGWVLP